MNKMFEVKVTEVAVKRWTAVGKSKNRVMEVVNAMIDAGELDMEKNLDSCNTIVEVNEIGECEVGSHFPNVEQEGYLKYLKEWAEIHTSTEYYGQSPVCFDEWCDMEYLEDEEDA